MYTGYFGNIYTQFKNNFNEAFDFLLKNRGGDAVSVFRRDEIGDIDLVWGDERGGLLHILVKHTGKGKSFNNATEARNAILSILENGDVVFNNGDKVVIREDSRVITLRKNIRERGKKIAEKNWILTAYDENAGDNTSAISGINQGQAAQTPNISADKVSDNSSTLQENENLLIRRLYGCAKINGELYRVKTTIKERKSAGIKPYTYEVTKIELLDGSSQEGTSSSDASSNSILGAKLLKGVEKSYDKGKLLLDESKKISEGSHNSEEIIAEVEREAAALGVPVRIARSVDELPDDADTRKRAEDGSLKGVYSMRDGEVVVYLPNTEDANDAKRTILHEIVGHKGLRQLFNRTSHVRFASLVKAEYLDGAWVMGIFVDKIRNGMVETGMHDMEPAMKCGKVINVKSLRSSDEVRQERWREKQASRARVLQARREMLLQAVEQAVTLPEPITHIPCEQVTEQASAQQATDAKTTRSAIGQSLRGIMKGAQDSVTSIFNRMYTVVMEEG